VYRSEDPRPTHICIVCYEALGLNGNTCGRCGSPLVSLETPEVIAALRKRAKARKDRPGTRQTIFALVVAGVLGVVAFVVLDKMGIYTVRENNQMGPDEGVLLDFWPVVVTFVLTLFPLMKVGGWLFPSVPGAKEFDPSTADVPALLKWLRLTMPPSPAP
jgi:hypothetical protein